jgi:N,N'-diacetylchitobiose transport system substrate-binding protein
MKRRSIVALSLVAVLVAAIMAATSSGATQKATANSITVWLQVDAQSGWPDLVAAANKQFQSDHPGTTVNVQYQGWPDHLQKFDATLAGGGGPDVIEMGNTEMTKYMAAGAFAPLNKSSFDNSANWLKGLAASGAYGGKTYGVPYYAGSRVVTYRTDLFKQAGIAAAPKTYDEFLSDADKLQALKKADSKFGAVLMPGKYWYAAMSWVKSSGGDIAKQDGGKWVGQLEQPASVAGLQKWVDLVKKYSKADPTKDENDQAQIFGQGGEAGMFVGNTWEQGAAEQVKKDPNDPNSKLVDTKVKGKLATAPMPEIPSFLGGSNLGVTEKSANKQLAAQWIKYFTDAKSMDGLVKANALPNSTALLDKAATDNPALASAAGAAKSSWFVPNAQKWADVEKSNVLKTMLTDILTGKKTVADGAKWADDQMNTTLNES